MKHLDDLLPSWVYTVPWCCRRLRRKKRGTNSLELGELMQYDEEPYRRPNTGVSVCTCVRVYVCAVLYVLMYVRVVLSVIPKLYAWIYTIRMFTICTYTDGVLFVLSIHLSMPQIPPIHLSLCPRSHQYTSLCPRSHQYTTLCPRSYPLVSLCL